VAPRASTLSLALCLALRAGVVRAHEPGEATVRAEGARRSASDYTFDVGVLRAVPRNTAAELLSLAPGFFLSQHGGDGKANQIFLRGFDAQHGQDLEFTVGGMPSNDVSNVHGQGYADLNWVIPEVVDRLRVLEGPYDPRQGDFAVAGSARFELGVQDRGVLLRGQYGMFGAARVLGLFAPRGERRETFVAGEFARSDGFGENRASSRASVNGQYMRGLAAGATLRVLASSYVARFDSAGVVRASDVDRGFVAWDGTYDTLQGGAASRHGLLVELVVPDGRNRTTVSAYGFLREFLSRENFTGFAQDVRGDRYTQSYDAGVLGLAASHRRTFDLGGLAHTWELGVAARHDRTTQAMTRHDTVSDAPRAATVDADVYATDIGLWADVDLRLTRRLSVRGGMRAEALAYQINDRTTRTVSRTIEVPRGRREAQGFALGPRVTVEYDAGRGVSLLGSFGQGFRSPQALSLGDGESAPFATVLAGDVGARLRHRVVNATLSAFATHVDRDLIFVPELGTNVTIDASAATTRFGLAATVRVTPARGVELTASGAWSRATFDASGALVPYVPPLVARVDLGFARDIARIADRPLMLMAGLGATVLGARPLPFSESSPPVFVLDLGLSARYAFLEVGVSARNLTDARWRDGVFNYVSNFDPSAATSRVPAQHYSAGRPLTVLGTVGFLL
jgi:hypothetical protein